MDKSSLIEKIYRSQYSYNKQLPGPFGDRYITYADYIASGQSSSLIEDFIQNEVLPFYANTHTEASYTGLQTSKYREEARLAIKQSVNASEEDVVLFAGSGCTGAIDLLIRKLTQFYQTQDAYPVVFIGPFEHHSNILPWREGPFELVELPISNGNVDLHALEVQLKKYHHKKPMIGSFSAASNVTGILAPQDEIHRLLKKYDALSFWDYAGAGPYMPIDMNPKETAGKDAIFMSPHKLIGGPGTPGVLICKKSLFQGGLPVVIGGGTVDYVTKKKQKYIDHIESREEGGTPAILGSIRAGLAFKLKDQVGAELIQKIEHQYITEAIETFKLNKNVFVLGNTQAPRLGFMAFLIRFNDKFLHHNFVVALLNDLFGIQSRGGCSCAGPYGHDLLDITDEDSDKILNEMSLGNLALKPGWVRLNFNYFIPREEFTYLLDCVTWISLHGWKLLNLYRFDDCKGLWTCKLTENKSLRSLDDFPKTQKPFKGNSTDKRAQRKAYLEYASKLAEVEWSKLNEETFQTYTYDQVNNPMRWFSLVQDIELEQEG